MRRPFSPVHSHGIFSFGEAAGRIEHNNTPATRCRELTEHVLCAGSADDDLRLQRGHADLHAGVAVLRKLAGEHLVELGEEHAIGNELQVTQDTPGERRGVFRPLPTAFRATARHHEGSRSSTQSPRISS